jgi:hypothetical protein
MLVGCVPVQYTKRPGTGGVVIDADSRRPLPQTTVRLLAPVYPSGTPAKGASAVEVVSGNNGRFHITRRTGWWLRPLFLAVDPVAQQGRLSAEREGYAPASRVLVEWDLENVRIELPPR